MTEYQIQPATRRCTSSGRELLPGERYFSVLLDQGVRFVRYDYAAEAWSGPPEGAFSFWTGKVPVSGGKRRPPPDDELLLDCFGRLDEAAEPAKLNFRYILALLLLRRRRFRLEDGTREDGREVLTFRCARTGTRHRVVNPGLTEAETAAVQDDVFQALGWD